MRVITEEIDLKTKGAGDLVDITASIKEKLDDSGLREGNVTVFVVGSTAAITSFEYEPGLIKDMTALYEKLAPEGKPYAHDQTWGDANGFSHVRAALQGPSLVVPFADGKLLLGTWQQVVLAEFDHRPRQRKVIFQFIGE
ncbi:MAG: secondary thiamine-phosphate synthase enzyme YjbQ [Candidatus Omnitrophica bacterium]|nr:secondary thiamine-phosphate synthase enzyme YjbQ [Candidatus Omnitrophota bacterium]